MTTDVVLPVLGLTMSEGTIVRWLKRVGDAVATDEPLLIVETDKAATEVLSPAAGVVAEILAAEGAVVPVEQVIARLAPSGAAIAARPHAPAPVRPAAAEPTVIGRTQTPTITVDAPTSARLGPTDAPRPIGTPSFPAPVDGDEPARARWMFHAMLRIRAFDERIVKLFTAGKIAGALHSYVGEEAVAAGVCVHGAPTTTSPARTAATATCSPRADGWTE